MKTKGKGSNPKQATAIAEYSFRQRFRVPAAWAFRWCVDYTPHDWDVSGVPGSRKVIWLAPRTVVLDDTFPAPGGRRVRKVKMVQIYPDTRSWVSTHILGPRHHSQFRYRVVPEGKNGSALVFEGRELAWSGAPHSPASARQWTKRVKDEDVDLWKRFAVEMERDFASP